jgi:hypothetical protein
MGVGAGNSISLQIHHDRINAPHAPPTPAPHGVHKFGRTREAPDLQGDRICAPHGIVGELKGVGVIVSATSVRKVLAEAGAGTGARTLVVVDVPPPAGRERARL